MINNLETDFQTNLNNYKTNNTPENKQELQESIKKIDIYLTKTYLEELKNYNIKTNDLEGEQNRLKNILTLMQKRIAEREKHLKIIEELSLDLTLENIPNIDKSKSFANKLKVIETITNITSKINNSNKEKAIEILNRKEFKVVLQEFSIIQNDTKEDIENYLNSLLKKEIKKIPIANEVSNSNIKILDYYYENKKDFPNLSIPNMGLVEDKSDIKIDNNSFFTN